MNEKDIKSLEKNSRIDRRVVNQFKKLQHDLPESEKLRSGANWGIAPAFGGRVLAERSVAFVGLNLQERRDSLDQS